MHTLRMKTGSFTLEEKGEMIRKVKEGESFAALGRFDFHNSEQRRGGL